MIGNDIVDLKLASIQSNWKRPGFLEKQFTSDEISKIKSATNPFKKVWLFWSMKEAAYKCYVQLYEKRFFAPKRFKCILKNECHGKVIFDDMIYHTKSLFTEDYIHSVARLESVENFKTFCFKSLENRSISEQINHKICELLSNNIEVKKGSLNIPFLFKDGKKQPYSLSKSHHGNYASFAISHI